MRRLGCYNYGLFAVALTPQHLSPRKAGHRRNRWVIHHLVDLSTKVPAQDGDGVSFLI